MTNAEKFKEVFGYAPDTDSCIAPQKVCDKQAELHIKDADIKTMCEDCPFKDWWHKEYKECFKMKEDFGDYPGVVQVQFDNMTGSMNL